MERIRACAELSVRRGCGFAALAILTFMFGLSAAPVLALRAGAILTALASVVLFLKALRAPNRDYRRTELWVLLDRNHGLPEAHAERIINTVLRDVYLRYAEFAGLIALTLWALTLIGRLFS